MAELVYRITFDGAGVSNKEVTECKSLQTQVKHSLYDHLGCKTKKQ